LKSFIFWDITPCSSMKVNRRFAGTCVLRLRSWGVSQPTVQHEAGGKQSFILFLSLITSLQGPPFIVIYYRLQSNIKVTPKVARDSGKPTNRRIHILQYNILKPNSKVLLTNIQNLVTEKFSIYSHLMNTEWNIRALKKSKHLYILTTGGSIYFCLLHSGTPIRAIKE
jgi:hypothetical protein